MAEYTPMMKQYFETKEQYPDTILLFRLGDFYEMFFDDAKTVSKELELTLTGRDCGQEERAPMCGVPFHSADGYIARLVANGHKVAICEQTEDPALAKGLVKREVIRVITPGTVIESNMLDESKNNFLGVICSDETCAGLCFVDVSTGEVQLTEIDGENSQSKIISEFGRYSPKEILVNSHAAVIPELRSVFSKKIEATVELLSGEKTDYEKCLEVVKNHFQNFSLDCLESAHQAVCALGCALSYLYETQKTNLENITDFSFYSESGFMQLDPSARRNLELTETMRSREKKGSLLWVLDKTKTAMGKRLIRSWIEQPLVNCAAIIKRHNAVEELVMNMVLRSELISLLTDVYDIERLLTRIVYGSANARELRSLAYTVEHTAPIKERLEGCTSMLLGEIRKDVDTLEDVHDLIDAAITEDPPFSVREGGLIKDGFSEELDSLREIVGGGKEYLAKIEEKEQERTGIKKLKIGYNRVFGYYIEVTNSYKELVPPEYIRKQTLANCERYITQELKELESKVLGAQERIVQLEYQIFCDVRQRVSEQLHRIQQTAKAVAKLDVLCSFAEAAVSGNFVRPDIDDGDVIEIKDGRHPVVEKMLDGAPFVPNDTLLDCGENRAAIITGPNMAGKSTYMRQVALIVLMAQIGSFVPASRARIGITDSIFTRVGASDDLAAGQSTFMVEMSEVAAILSQATSKSLIILDEIGRGTSTFDGMSIAQAVLEYVCDKRKLGAKTLFATHYHELTEMENTIEGVKNYNIAVKKRGDDITFLRRIVRGGADGSYGIDVAKLAGIPGTVVKRARVILKDLEENGHEIQHIPAAVKQEEEEPEENLQLSLIPDSSNEIVEKLKEIDINTLTPIEAMSKLYELIKLAGK